MAANMPQMVTNGQMMLLQQQQQGQQQQGQNEKQLNQYIYNSIMQHMATLPGNSWHGNGSNMTDRYTKAFNLVSNMRLAAPATDWLKVTNMGLEMERKTFHQSPDKQSYDHAMDAKISDMVKRRHVNAPELQNQLSNDAARQAQLQARQQQQQQLFMNQMAAARAMGQPPQRGFQSLQNPMQVPAMPQPPQQIGMGMGAPGMLQNRPDQRQFAMPMGQVRQPGGFAMMEMNQLAPHDRLRLHELTQTLIDGASEAQKLQIRQAVHANMSQAQLTDLAATGKDPLYLYFQSQALAQLRNRAAQRVMMQQRSGMPTNVMPQAPHQGQMNPALMNPLSQQPLVPDGQMFAPNMESIRNEQQMGLLAQQAGQMVVPASAGPGRNATPGSIPGLPPQPAPSNQQGPNPTPRPHQMQQPFGMPQVKMDPAGAQTQAQQGARTAGRVLQGQPGGMATPNPPSQTSQSPAMNTLNAPMRQTPVPVGQGNGQPMGQGNTPMGPTLNPQFNHQNNTRPPSLQVNMNNPAMVGMVTNLAPEARAGMGAVPENAGMRELIAQLGEQQRASANNGFQGLKQGQAPGIPGQFSPGPMNGSNQAATINANQNGNGLMAPAQQPTSLQQQQQLAIERARFQAYASSPQAQRSMQSMDVPQQILNQLRGNGTIQGDIRKWAQLWQVLQANPNAMGENLMRWLQQYQLSQFKSLLERKRAMTMPPGGPQPPNAPIPQQQANQAPGLPPNVYYPPALAQVTPQDLENLRKSQPRFRAMPDELLTEIAKRVKRDGFAKKAWGYYNQQMAGAAGVQTAPPPVPPASNGQPGGVITPTSQPTPRQGAQQQAAQTKPAGSLATDVVASPAAATLKNGRPPPNPSPAQGSKNLKRPNPDDAGDVPAQSSNALQRPSSQSDARHPAGVAKPATDQPTKPSPDQQKVATRAPAPQGMEAKMAEIKRLVLDEQRQVAKEVKALAAIPMTPAELQEMRVKIKEAVGKFNQFRGNSLPIWYLMTKDESRVRMFFRRRFRIVAQYADSEKMTDLRDSFNISKAEVDQSINFFNNMLQELHSGKKANQEGAAANPAQAGGHHAPQPAPLSAANLERQTQALKQAQNRTVAKTGQPPAAPTTSQPPFQFAAQTSSAGNPEYHGEQRVTQANLAIPPARKKAKTAAAAAQMSAPSAPQQAASLPSPQVQAPSPVAGRKPEPPKAPPKLTCPEPSCEMNALGFQTEEARTVHVQEEHIKPFENPYGFLQEHMAAAMGLDSQGKPKPSPKPSGQGGPTPNAPPMSASGSMQGQTATSRPESTPMSRDVSMRRQGSAAGSRPGEKSSSTGRNAGAKTDATPPVGDGRLAAGIQGAGTVDPQDLFANLGNSLDSVTGNFMSDFGTYRSVTPNDTPESNKDSVVSEPTSDIPEGAALDIAMSIDQALDLDLLMNMDNFGVESHDEGNNEGLSEEFLRLPLEDVLEDFSRPFRVDTARYFMDAAS